MSFAAPLFLAALLVIPLGFAAQRASARRRQRYAIRFPATATVGAVLVRQSRARRFAPPLLLVLAVAALALALARPQTTVAVPSEQASVVLIIDTSRSMEADDVSPNRLAAAQRAAQSFLDEVPKELNVGVVGFSDVIHTVQRPIRDREPVRLTIDSFNPVGGTNTGGGLEAALEVLTRVKPGEARPPGAIILLSDGKATDGPDPVGVARRARRARIPVSTVALGTPDGAVQGGPYGGFLPVPPDPATMRRIARASGGQAFTARSSDSLKQVYQRLGSRIGTKTEKREVTSTFALGGLLFLLGGAGLAARWRGAL